MERLSVKKPFTILVAVIMVLLLGFVSVTRMTLDLLPELTLPYLIVVTTYPGASPERVESDVIKPLESALGTVSGVKNVFSTSSENYGMVQLEFEEDTDMDSALVKISSATQEAAASLPEGCGTPSIIELSLDMMATMYVSVSKEGADIYELSNFVKNDIQPFIERQEGVASVSPSGLVEQSVHIELDKDKIDALNEDLLEYVDEALGEAAAELDKAEREVQNGKYQLQQAQSAFGETFAGAIFDPMEGTVEDLADNLSGEVLYLRYELLRFRNEITNGQTGQNWETLTQRIDSIVTELDVILEMLEKEEKLTMEDLVSIGNRLQIIAEDVKVLLELAESLETQFPNEGENSDNSGVHFGGGSDLMDGVRDALRDMEAGLDGLSDGIAGLPEMMEGLETAVSGLTQAQMEAAVGFSTASSQLTAAEAQLEAARTQYETAKEEALAKANLDQLLNVSTLSQLIYAQNFAMPAGYIDDAEDHSWLLKVGEEYGSVDDLRGALLTSMDGLGDIRLGDVAEVTIIDNAGESYTRLNGEQAVILSIFKNSTTGTNETANNCLEAFDELEQKHEGCQIETLMNQGSYISLIVGSIVSSMVTGAGLAIIILALFLKDVKPTLVVAFSIPLSVLIAIILMYFTDISLNMMSLSGLALGIGMLVDNSIVIIENIYRLRSRGVAAPRAAVQGTKQVSTAIISSTLTTVCVFLPLVFTSGMVRQLLLPMGLSIGYCLLASLIVAMTIVPAAASALLRNTKAKAHPWFDKMMDKYELSLKWCLKHKAIPLLVSVALLVFSVWAVMTTGIVLLPEMTSDSIQVTVRTPEGLTREESFAMSDEVIDTILKVEGVEAVGAMDSGSSSGLLGGFGGSNDSYGSYVYYIIAENGGSTSAVTNLVNNINAATADMEAEVMAFAGGMSDMTALLGSGLSVTIYGNDLKVLRELSDDIIEIVDAQEGYTDASSSFTNGDPTIQLKIDKDLAMSKGLTVAQIYMEIASRLTTSATSTTVTIDGVTMDVTVENNSNPLTVENLMDIEFETTSMTATGESKKETYKLSDFASIEETTSIASISRENQTRSVTVSAAVEEGYNATLLSRELTPILQEYADSDAVPDGYTVDLGGESSTVNDMVEQMGLMLLLGCAFIYLIMVAQFQSLLSPFIVLFTVPLAFTGGMIALLLYGQSLSLLSLVGFVVLMGTVVNNGIVFVDYTNQLRIGGMERQAALIATGRTRMRPILMTAMTTILAMMQMIFADDMSGQMGGGMSVVIVGGLAYATLMTLYIIPVLYDIFFKRPPLQIDVGGDNIDDVPDDAAEFIAEALAKEAAQKAEVQEKEEDGE